VTTFEFVQEVQERVHVGELEILDLVRRNWPGRDRFNRTQVNLAVWLIEKEAANGKRTS